MPVKKKATKKLKIAKAAKQKNSAKFSSEEILKIEHDKRLAMWAGIVFTMVIIVTAWIFNFKNNIEIIADDYSTSQNKELGEIFIEFSEAAKQVQEELVELKQADETIQQPEEDNGLENKLEELKKISELENFLSELNKELNSVND